MKKSIYITIILFIGLNLSAQEKMSIDELNSFLKKSISKELSVTNGVLNYKDTLTYYSLSFNIIQDKEPITKEPITKKPLKIEFNLNKPIVYRKEYDENKHIFKLSLTFRDKDEIQKTGFKKISFEFKESSVDEINSAIATLKSYYDKK